MALKGRLDKLEQRCHIPHPNGPVQTWSQGELERYIAEYRQLDPLGIAKIEAKLKGMSRAELLRVRDGGTL